MNSIKSNQHYFPALTGLRAIAAFMVYFHHFNPINKDLFGNKIFDFFSELHIGVTLFFVLSGFLITYRYYNLPKIDLKQYMINRFARIYPMYFLLTTITFLVFAVINYKTFYFNFKVFFLNITFIRGFFDEFKFTGIAQGWSLTVEEMFYLLAPFLFIIIKKSKLFLLLLPLLFLFLGFFLVAFFTNVDFYGLFKTNDFMLDFTFFGRCTEFFLGMALAIFIQYFKKFKTNFLTYFGAISVLICVYLLSLLKANGKFGTDCLEGKVINTFLLPLLGILPLLLGLIREKTHLSRLLESKIFQWLGKSSYVFYLIHTGVFVLILKQITSNYIFLFLSLNLISIFLYQFVEKPSNAFLRKSNLFFKNSKN